VADYNRHMGYVDKADRNIEVDKKAVFPPVRHGHSQQLHLAVYMWWEENLAQTFSFHPCHGDAGKSCA
jgi:hypothetical protein